MANTVSNVSTGKPAVSGGVYVAPLGTTLPTNASSSLAADYKSLGYVAQEGVTNNNSMETDTYRAWGGDIVLVYQTGKNDTFAFNLIESKNLDVLKTVYGSANVSGALATGITVRANATDLPACVYVIEIVMRDNVLKRIVIPNGKISEVGEITYADEQAIAYPLTITAMAGSDGDTHKEYIVTASTST